MILTIDGDWLQIVLKDNGCGFVVLSEQSLVNSGHFGLKIMQERIERVNGHFEVISALGEGTQLQIRVPCLPTQSPDVVQRNYPWRVFPYS